MTSVKSSGKAAERDLKVVRKVTVNDTKTHETKRVNVACTVSGTCKSHGKSHMHY